MTLRTDLNLGGSRSGTATVAGQTVTINQAATLCLWSVSPLSRNAKANGEEGERVTVTAGAGCPWTATSNVSWITVTSRSLGERQRDRRYGVARNNTNAVRSGTITIAGETFTVSQANDGQRAIDGRQQLARRERLLKEVHAFFQRERLPAEVGAMAAHEHERHAPAGSAEALRELAAADPFGHHKVGQHQPDFVAVLIPRRVSACVPLRLRAR